MKSKTEKKKKDINKHDIFLIEKTNEQSKSDANSRNQSYDQNMITLN